ncbi:MAG: hypothetical protein KC609_21000 [Myxococcales bacterium]|nr:hypothetical protein [Myxococcales bacterium]
MTHIGAVLVLLLGLFCIQCGGGSTSSSDAGSLDVGADSVGADSVGADSVGADSVGADSDGSDLGDLLASDLGLDLADAVEPTDLSGDDLASDLAAETQGEDTGTDGENDADVVSDDLSEPDLAVTDVADGEDDLVDGGPDPIPVSAIKELQDEGDHDCQENASPPETIRDVALAGVVVTTGWFSIDADQLGIYVADEDGGDRSGILLVIDRGDFPQGFEPQPLAPGTRVNLTGMLEEAACNTQIRLYAEPQVVDVTTPVTPLLVTCDDLLWEYGERVEGMLVVLQQVTVVEVGLPGELVAVQSPNGNVCLLGSDFIGNWADVGGPQVGTTYSSVVGAVRYVGGAYLLEPLLDGLTAAPPVVDADDATDTGADLLEDSGADGLDPDTIADLSPSDDGTDDATEPDSGTPDTGDVDASGADLALSDADSGVDAGCDPAEIGKSCTLTQNKGECQAGTIKCVDGAPTCVQTVFPVTEVCRDKKDNDCDGTKDEICGRMYNYARVKSDGTFNFTRGFASVSRPETGVYRLSAGLPSSHGCSKRPLIVAAESSSMRPVTYSCDGDDFIVTLAGHAPKTLPVTPTNWAFSVLIPFASSGVGYGMVTCIPTPQAGVLCSLSRSYGSVAVNRLFPGVYNISFAGCDSDTQPVFSTLVNSGLAGYSVGYYVKDGTCGVRTFDLQGNPADRSFVFWMPSRTAATYAMVKKTGALYAANDFGDPAQWLSGRVDAGATLAYFTVTYPAVTPDSAIFVAPRVFTPGYHTAVVKSTGGAFIYMRNISSVVSEPNDFTILFVQ